MIQILTAQAPLWNLHIRRAYLFEIKHIPPPPSPPLYSDFPAAEIQSAKNLTRDPQLGGDANVCFPPLTDQISQNTPQIYLSVILVHHNPSSAALGRTDVFWGFFFVLFFSSIIGGLAVTCQWQLRCTFWAVGGFTTVHLHVVPITPVPLKAKKKGLIWRTCWGANQIGQECADLFVDKSPKISIKNLGGVENYSYRWWVFFL